MENLNGIITQVTQISPNMKVFKVVPDGWELPDFKPGQFVGLGLPASSKRCCEATEEYEKDKTDLDPDKIIKRAYSIASSSTSKNHLEFYITLIHSGELTPRLFALEIGDRLWVGTKFTGTFTLDEVDENQHLILLGTGTGLAPYMSMLRTDALHRKGKVIVVHGAANSWDLGYSSELSLLQNMAPNFVYIPTVLHPEKEVTSWKGETSYFQDLWKNGTLETTSGVSLNAGNTHVFLCGNPRMINTMVEVLGEKGFAEYSRKTKEGQIHIEKY